MLHVAEEKENPLTICMNFFTFPRQGRSPSNEGMPDQRVGHDSTPSADLCSLGRSPNIDRNPDSEQDTDGKTSRTRCSVHLDGWNYS